ncbi:MAG: hypothetical protein IPJ19_00360 [Planctomycetes bacterium]|nr:hypothetical protein [Planctomycetota bacterium]
MQMNWITLALLFPLALNGCTCTTPGGLDLGALPPPSDRGEIEWSPVREEGGELVLERIWIGAHGRVGIESAVLRFEDGQGAVLDELRWNEGGHSSFLSLGGTRVKQSPGIRVSLLVTYTGGEALRLQLR